MPPKRKAVKKKMSHPKHHYRRHVKKAHKHLSEVSPELRKWIAECGDCDLEIAWERSLYEALVRAIAHQQLHGRAAETILGRLKAGFPGHDFPPPEKLARASTKKLRAMGFSSAKTVAIQGVAKAVASGHIPARADAESWTDEALIERLVELKGVGNWTVEMLLIFTLGRLDIMPVDDFGVRSGLMHLLGLKEMPKKTDFETHTAHWRPYRSIAAWYLWRKADAAKIKKS